MSLKVLTLIWDIKSGLTGIEKSILLRLADFGSDDGHRIFPGMNRLCSDTAFSRSTIIRTIESLIEKKVLVKRAIKKDKKNECNQYTIRINALKNLINSQTRLKKVRGSVTETLGGSVTETLGGSVTETPKPLDITVSNNRDKNIVEQTRPDSDVSGVFKYWQEVMGHKRAVLADARRRLIVRTLKSYSVEDVKKAVLGCSRTPHNMGENERGGIYDGLHIILDEKNIDRFIRNADNPPKPRKTQGNDFRKQKINPDMLRKIQNKHIRHNQEIQGEIE